MTAPIAVIGGTGLATLDTLNISHRETRSCPMASRQFADLGELGGQTVVFLARHGQNHTIPPHKVNYRANLWVLHHIGVKQVIAVAAVGGFVPTWGPGALQSPIRSLITPGDGTAPFSTRTSAMSPTLISPNRIVAHCGIG